MIEALTGDSLERKVFFKKLQISQRKKSLLESLYNEKALKGQEKENSSARKPEMACFMFHNSFTIVFYQKNSMEEKWHPRYFKRRKVSL